MGSVWLDLFKITRFIEVVDLRNVLCQGRLCVFVGSVWLDLFKITRFIEVVDL